MKKITEKTVVEVAEVEAAVVSPLTRLLAGPVVAKIGRTNDKVIVTNPLVMTDAEKDAFRRLYPSAGLGVRAMLSVRPSTFQEVVAFSKDVYGGTQEKAESRTRGLFGDKSSKMALRYALTCTDGIYSVKTA